MLLINGVWEKGKTFKLIPITPESPFNEGIYDPDARILVLISKQTKQTLHMMARLNSSGDPVPAEKRVNGKDYAEERRILDSYYEYYIDTPEDIRELVNTIAVNSGRFDYQKFMTPAPQLISASKVVTM